MRSALVILLFWLLPIAVFSQDEQIKQLLTDGIALFEEGKYEAAIAEFEKILEKDKENTAALFEIGYAYYALKDYDMAIKYSDKVIRKDKGNLLEAYNLKGNTLDDIGKSDKAIKVYEQGIKKFPDQYLLHFNLGISHYRLQHFAEAEAALQQTISIKFNHKSSHYYLGKLMAETGQRVPSLMANYFFLLLEPTGERAEYTYDLVQKQINQGIEKNEDGGIKINITTDQLDSEYAPVEMMLGLSVNSAEQLPIDDKSEEAKFAVITQMIFSTLDESRKDHKGFYWDTYVDLFGKIKASDHINTYCYYISQSRSEKAAKWVEDNAEKVDEFFKWLNE